MSAMPLILLVGKHDSRAIHQACQEGQTVNHWPVQHEG